MVLLISQAAALRIVRPRRKSAAHLPMYAIVTFYAGYLSRKYGCGYSYIRRMKSLRLPSDADMQQDMASFSQCYQRQGRHNRSQIFFALTNTEHANNKKTLFIVDKA